MKAAGAVVVSRSSWILLRLRILLIVVVVLFAVMLLPTMLLIMMLLMMMKTPTTMMATVVVVVVVVAPLPQVVWAVVVKVKVVVVAPLPQVVWAVVVKVKVVVVAPLPQPLPQVIWVYNTRAIRECSIWTLQYSRVRHSDLHLWGLVVRCITTVTRIILLCESYLACKTATWGRGELHITQTFPGSIPGNTVLWKVQTVHSCMARAGET